MCINCEIDDCSLLGVIVERVVDQVVGSMKEYKSEAEQRDRSNGTEKVQRSVEYVSNEVNVVGQQVWILG